MRTRESVVQQYASQEPQHQPQSQYLPSTPTTSLVCNQESEVQQIVSLDTLTSTSIHYKKKILEIIFELIIKKKIFIFGNFFFSFR